MHVYCLNNVLLKLATLHPQRAGEVNEKMADVLEQCTSFVRTFYETSRSFRYYKGIATHFNIILIGILCQPLLIIMMEKLVE
jgi:hypothetical protein